MKHCDILLGFKKDIWVFHIIADMGRTAFSAVTDLIPVNAYGYDSGIMTISVETPTGLDLAAEIGKLHGVEFASSPDSYKHVLHQARVMKGLEEQHEEILTLETLFRAIFGI